MAVRMLTGLAAVALLAGCTTTGGSGGQSPLVGTWRLVELQSSDDAIGTTRPADPSKYEMTLEADGSVAMQLNCNRAFGKWQSEGPSQVTFGQMGMTRAMCLDESLDTRIARQMEFVRTYVLQGNRLSLNMFADGGNLVWDRVGS
jgi:heat shock protein HslJ